MHPCMMEAPVAGLYWNGDDGQVDYVWGVRRDPQFERETRFLDKLPPDADVERYALHAARLSFGTSGWGFWGVAERFDYDMTRDELAMFERLPMAVPLMGKGPFSTAVRVAMEDMAALPRLDRDAASKYLSEMPPIGTLRFLRTWWRTTVVRWYAFGPLPYWAAALLADIRMQDTLTVDPDA